MKKEIRGLKSGLEIVAVNPATQLTLPLEEGGVSAGFPSPAQDYTDLGIDLNKELVASPLNTFYCRVRGYSMKDEGINDGDILIVDKSIEPQDGDTVVCFVDGEFVLKYIRILEDGVYLVPANEKFKPIKVTDENIFFIWGVVTYSIKKHHS